MADGTITFGIKDDLCPGGGCLIGARVQLTSPYGYASLTDVWGNWDDRTTAANSVQVDFRNASYPGLELVGLDVPLKDIKLWAGMGPKAAVGDMMRLHLWVDRGNKPSCSVQLSAVGFTHADLNKTAKEYLFEKLGKVLYMHDDDSCIWML